MKNMPKLLQSANQGTQGTKLTEPRLFKLVFSDKLDNGYELKDMPSANWVFATYMERHGFGKQRLIPKLSWKK